jgi:peptidoglycan/LPS O-acetylase OafA/YrhL
MNLEEVMEGWRSQDASTLYGVDKTLLHQVLRQEHAKLEKQWRGERWVMSVVGPFMLIVAGLLLAIMIYSKDDDVLSVWDYVVGVVGVAAAIILAGAMFALRRSRQAREQGFGDSLRDHLRRHIAQLDDEATGESRLAFITLVTGLIYVWAIPFAMHRIDDVPSEPDWPSPLAIVLILGFLCWVLFRSMPRDRQRKLLRKRQLDALLKELDGQ